MRQVVMLEGGTLGLVARCAGLILNSRIKTCLHPLASSTELRADRLPRPCRPPPRGGEEQR